MQYHLIPTMQAERLPCRSRHGVNWVYPAMYSQQGISLLEALVAMLIVALGVLGMLGMQLGTLSDTRSSVQRAQAIRIIEDLSERVKSNPMRVTVLSAYVLPTWTETSDAQVRDCGAQVCSAEQQAAWDREEWHRHVPLSLPGAQAITFLSYSKDSPLDNWGQLGVMLAWPHHERYGQAGYQTVALSFEAAQDSGAAVVTCPDSMMCHLAYIQP